MLDIVSPTRSAFSPPAWVQDFLQIDPACSSLTSGKIAAAESVPDRDLQEQVRGTYEKILKNVSDLNQHPIRFWNNVPRITSPASEQRNRYMVFNAGRYAALNAFYGDASKFDMHMPAATAVGAGGCDLEIYCLSANVPPSSLNNPRQVAPYHYSKRFGPLPPCFARAIRPARPANWLIVGGTAAIRGEDSVYREDLVRQIHETLANMVALIGAARGEHSATDKNPSIHLAAYRELRIYFPNAEHETAIRQAIHSAFARVQRIEMVVADLCRPELLVEIEGIAELDT